MGKAKENRNMKKYNQYYLQIRFHHMLIFLLHNENKFNSFTKIFCFCHRMLIFSRNMQKSYVITGIIHLNLYYIHIPCTIIHLYDYNCMHTPNYINLSEFFFMKNIFFTYFPSLLEVKNMPRPKSTL